MCAIAYERNVVNKTAQMILDGPPLLQVLIGPSAALYP